MDFVLSWWVQPDLPLRHTETQNSWFIELIPAPLRSGDRVSVHVCHISPSRLVHLGWLSGLISSQISELFCFKWKHKVRKVTRTKSWQWTPPAWSEISTLVLLLDQNVLLFASKFTLFLSPRCLCLNWINETVLQRQTLNKIKRGFIYFFSSCKCERWYQVNFKPLYLLTLSGTNGCFQDELLLNIWFVHNWWREHLVKRCHTFLLSLHLIPRLDIY